MIGAELSLGDDRNSAGEAYTGIKDGIDRFPMREGVLDETNVSVRGCSAET